MLVPSSIPTSTSLAINSIQKYLVSLLRTTVSLSPASYSPFCVLVPIGCYDQNVVALQTADDAQISGKCLRACSRPAAASGNYGVYPKYCATKTIRGGANQGLQRGCGQQEEGRCHDTEQR
jgi:hypothetical protein